MDVAAAVGVDTTSAVGVGVAPGVTFAPTTGVAFSTGAGVSSGIGDGVNVGTRVGNVPVISHAVASHATTTSTKIALKMRPWVIIGR